MLASHRCKHWATSAPSAKGPPTAVGGLSISTNQNCSLVANDELTRRLDELEKRYDGPFMIVFKALRQILTPTTKRKPIGFRAKATKKQALAPGHSLYATCV